MSKFQRWWSDFQQQGCPEKGGVTLVPELTNLSTLPDIISPTAKAAIGNKDKSSPACLTAKMSIVRVILSVPRSICFSLEVLELTPFKPPHIHPHISTVRARDFVCTTVSQIPSF
jgi:hypothetical protein